MDKQDKNNTSEKLEKEEMTVDLELDDGTKVTCAVVTILTVAGKDYIALLPLTESGDNTDGEVWFYRYSENAKDPNEEPSWAISMTMRSTKPWRMLSTNFWTLPSLTN